MLLLVLLASLLPLAYAAECFPQATPIDMPKDGNSPATGTFLVSQRSWAYYSATALFDNPCVAFSLHASYQSGTTDFDFLASGCTHDSCPDSPSCYDIGTIVHLNHSHNDVSLQTPAPTNVPSGSTFHFGVYTYTTVGEQIEASVLVKMNQVQCGPNISPTPVPSPTPEPKKQKGKISGGVGALLFFLGIFGGCALGFFGLVFFWRKKGHFPFNLDRAASAGSSGSDGLLDNDAPVA